MITFWLALITGTKTHPRNWLIHQSRGSLENARRKFSVDSEKSMDKKITFTLSLGFGKTVTIKLPTTIAIPEKEVTKPSMLLPPRGFGITYAGRVASNADAIKFTPDIKRITYKIIGFSLRYFNPSFASRRMPSFFSPSFGISGIFMNPKSAVNAIANVIKSIAIAASRPAKP